MFCSVLRNVKIIPNQSLASTLRQDVCSRVSFTISIMLNSVRGALFCFSIIFAVQSVTSSWDFFLFKRNAIETPRVKIIPEAEGNFIYFKNGDESTIQRYVNSITGFLNTYDEAETEVHRQCDFNYVLPENSVCVFDRNYLGFCSQMKDFGYSKGSPCVYFTLSQVLDWTPIVLNSSDVQQSQSGSFLNMPSHLVEALNRTEKEKPLKKYIWLTCEGDTGADKEFIGPVSYYPRNGFPSYYFPFNNVDGYESPIVAVHFERPTPGVAITIICKAWAKNIQLDEQTGVGFVKFVLLVD